MTLIVKDGYVLDTNISIGSMVGSVASNSQALPIHLWQYRNINIYRIPTGKWRAESQQKRTKTTVHDRTRSTNSLSNA